MRSDGRIRRIQSGTPETRVLHSERVHVSLHPRLELQIARAVIALAHRVGARAAQRREARIQPPRDLVAVLGGRRLSVEEQVRVAEAEDGVVELALEKVGRVRATVEEANARARVLPARRARIVKTRVDSQQQQAEKER